MKNSKDSNLFMPFLVLLTEGEIPAITNIQGDGTNNTLGILAQLSKNNQWQLIVTIKQDFESKLNSYSFTVTIGQVSTYVELAVDNIHDNEPTIQPNLKTCHINVSLNKTTNKMNTYTCVRSRIYINILYRPTIYLV